MNKFDIVQRIVFCHCNVSVLATLPLLCDYAADVGERAARPIAPNCHEVSVASVGEVLQEEMGQLQARKIARHIKPFSCKWLRQ
jgi:hypothetical protein